MCAFDELTVARNEVGNRWNCLAIEIDAEVVDAFEQDDVRGSTLRKDVAIESSECALAPDAAGCAIPSAPSEAAAV
jgi:hypothetical protein